MSPDRFAAAVSDRLLHPLPGLRAQLRMSSMRRLHELLNVPPVSKARPSGVLMLIYPIDNEPGMVFIKRTDYAGVHSGQISFPGGKRELEDTDLLATALRESREEVGIVSDDVMILGRLTDLFIPPSRFLVSPFVGYCRYRPSFTRDPKEVNEVIELKIRDLFRDDAIKIRKQNTGMGIKVKVPAFVVERHVIWGATAMILSEFREVVKETLTVF